MAMSNKYIPSTKRLLNIAMAYKLYDNGLSDKAIADACAVSSETVARWRRKNNLQPNKAVKKKEEPKMSKLAQAEAEARAHGMTYGQYMLTKGR